MQQHRGFTLVEVLVCLGIVAILTSFALPSLQSTFDRARVTRTSNVVRQNAILVRTYSQDYQDAYPIAHANMNVASQDWYKALLAHGTIADIREVDPENVNKYGVPLIWMSAAMMYDPQFMRPGFTRPVQLAASVVVRSDQVSYPSLKGMMIEFYRRPLPDPTAFCCAGPLMRAPIAMADGSLFVGTRRDIIGGDRPVIIDVIGIPVYTTWGGYLGRDR